MKPAERAKSGNEQWLFKCDCGKEVIGRTIDVKRGFKHSCGCIPRGGRREASVTHDMFGTSIHNTWAQMIQRCTNPKAPGWKYYGGRGIKVCRRWRKFENFYADMGDRPTEELTLDRINNDGNYEPSNCRWVTRSQQAKNQRHPFRPRGANGRYIEWSVKHEGARVPTQAEIKDAIAKLNPVAPAR